jgi:hypothetical protein
MDHRKFLRLVSKVGLISLLLATCGSPTAVPVHISATSLPATLTTIPNRTSTETPVILSSISPSEASTSITAAPDVVRIENPPQFEDACFCKADPSSSTGGSYFCKNKNGNYDKVAACSLEVLYFPGRVLNGSDIDVSSEGMPICEQCIDDWNKTVDESLGVIGQDNVGEFIRQFAAERFVVVDIWRKAWSPLGPQKQTLCGKLHHWGIADGGWGDVAGDADEMDWNIFIIPDPPFLFLYDDAFDRIRPTGHDKYAWQACNNVGCLEAEVTPDQKFYANPWFPKNRGQSLLEGSDGGYPVICTYGPWVRDIGHGDKPEIHPAELFWWKEPIKNIKFGITRELLWLMQIQDDSNRFDETADFSRPWPFDTDFPYGWRPWAAPPRRNSFLIAFELDPKSERMLLEIGEPVNLGIHERFSSEDVYTEDYPIYGVPPDSADRRLHTITYDGTVVVEAHEVQPVDEDISIRFIGVHRNQENTRLRGYLQIYSAISGPALSAPTEALEAEGYHVIYVSTTKTIPAVLGPEAQIPEDPPVFIDPSRQPKVTISVQPLSGTLRRVTSEGQAQLVGDVQVHFLLEQDPNAEDLSVTNIDLITSSKDTFSFRPDQMFLLDSQLPTNTLKLEGLPLFGSEKLDVQFTSNQTAQAGVAGILFAPQPVDEIPLTTESADPAWLSIANAIGAESIKGQPPTSVLYVREWQLEIAPGYARTKEGRPSPEDESPWSEEINSVLENGEPTEIESLFGAKLPFPVSWKFQAINLSTGEEVPVALNEEGTPQAVHVLLLPGKKGGLDVLDAAARVIFPESSDNSVYRLNATAIMEDTFGNTAEVDFEIWSYLLAVENNEEIDELLKSVSVLANAPEELLLFYSDMTDLLAPNMNQTLNEQTDRYRKTLLLDVLDAATDHRITIRELERLIRDAKTLGNR